MLCSHSVQEEPGACSGWANIVLKRNEGLQGCVFICGIVWQAGNGALV